MDDNGNQWTHPLPGKINAGLNNTSIFDMATTIQQIRALLGLPKTQLYAELRLADGRVVVTEADDFAEGTDLRLIGEDGTTVELSSGSYETADGDELVVDGQSKLSSINTPQMAEEKEKPEDLREDEKQEDMNMEKIKKALIDELELDEALASKVAAIAAGIYATKTEAEKEDEKEMEHTPDHKKDEEMEDEKKHEMASLFTEMAEKLAGLEHRLAKFEDEPASAGVDTAPTPKQTNFNSELQGMDRMLSYFNSTKK